MDESAGRPTRWRFGAPFEWALLALSCYLLVDVPDARWLGGAAAVQALSSIAMVNVFSARSIETNLRTKIAGSLFLVRWLAGGAMLLVVLIQLLD